jgi:hypothetical protein
MGFSKEPGGFRRVYEVLTLAVSEHPKGVDMPHVIVKLWPGKSEK